MDRVREFTSFGAGSHEVQSLIQHIQSLNQQIDRQQSQFAESFSMHQQALQTLQQVIAQNEEDTQKAFKLLAD